MIPSKDLFSDMMQNLGLNNEDEIIIYDNSPLLSSARAWFLLRYFGHKNILILNHLEIIKQYLIPHVVVLVDLKAIGSWMYLM